MIRQHLATFAADRAHAASLRMRETLWAQLDTPFAFHGTLYYDKLRLAYTLAELRAAFWLSLAEQCQRRPREAQG